MKKIQKGFTLIELMVVVVIIGILAAVAVPKMFGMSAKAKVSEAPQTLGMFERLQSVYFAETSLIGDLSTIGVDTTDLAASSFFSYTDGHVDSVTNTSLTANLDAVAGDCPVNSKWVKKFSTAGLAENTKPTTTACAAYTPNFKE
jgi:prepilin-type N-terminal cleavage/methylation domain-containing protein